LAIMATFLLIHGACHGGWCWRYVAERLHGAGHVVFAPSLTGLGDRAHLLTRAVDLETHVADVIGVLEAEELEDVVLVGHSYGGMVIAPAADRAANRIRSLVFLDAHVPEDGKSCFDLMLPERAQGMRRHAETAGQGWLLPPVPSAAFGVTGAADRAWVDRRTGPHPIATMAQPARLGSAWLAIRKTYILCEAPYASIGSSSPNPFPAYAARLRQAPGWTVRTLPCGHDAMIAMPDALTKLLLEAI
jgi:pimeloyl-ACP methyl ester carboxylesterase